MTPEEYRDYVRDLGLLAVTDASQGTFCPPLGLMTPRHPQWNDFAATLEGPQGCNFRKEGDETKWSCNGGRDKTHAIRILREMGASVADVFYSLQYFEASGGYCDCEILFNVDAPQRRIAAIASGRSRTRKNPKLTVNAAKRVKRRRDRIQ